MFIVPMMYKLGGRVRTTCRRIGGLICFVAVLQQEIKFPKHIGDVTAVDFIDDEVVVVCQDSCRALLRCPQIADHPVNSKPGLPIP